MVRTMPHPGSVQAMVKPGQGVAGVATGVALFLACGCGDGLVPADKEAPSCWRVYATISDSLRELHVDAGRPAPELPHQRTWVMGCRELALTPAQLRCLEPRAAADQPTSCARELAELEELWDKLNGPFLDGLQRVAEP